MTHKMLSVFAVLSVSMLTGCANPAVGDWISKDHVGSERNELSLEDDDKGEARIYFYADGDGYVADFDVEWEKDGDKIIIDMECEGDCASLDFEMECELNDDDDELDCEGDGTWRDYDFEWKRD